jgi:hypothetical protein
MESPDVGVADDDAAATLEIVGKQAAVAPALGVFWYNQMLFPRLSSCSDLGIACGLYGLSR